jgi:hypothetical protein
MGGHPLRFENAVSFGSLTIEIPFKMVALRQKAKNRCLLLSVHSMASLVHNDTTKRMTEYPFMDTRIGGETGRLDFGQLVVTANTSGTVQIWLELNRSRKFDGQTFTRDGSL